MALSHRAAKFCPTPPSERGAKTMRSCGTPKTTGFTSFSANLIPICKPDGPLCRIVVNRDPGRPLGGGCFSQTGPKDLQQSVPRGILCCIRCAHKGLQRLAERDDARLVPQHLTRRIRRILTELAAA